VNAEGRVAYTSPSTTRLLGYSASETVGQDPSAFTRRDDVPVVRGRLVEIAQRPGDTVTVACRFRHRDGSWRWLESHVTNLLAEPAVGAIIFNYRDIPERKQAEAELRRQLHRLAALRAIDMAITSSLDVRLTLDVLLQQVTEQPGVDPADVLLLDHSTQTLAYAAGRGFRTSALGQTRQRLGEGHARPAALERQLVHVPALRAAAPRFRRTGLLVAEGFVSYFGAPLISNGEMQGVLEVFHRSGLTPDDNWRAFLEALAGRAAIAVDNAQLFDNLQHTNVELLASYDATIEGSSRALDLRDKETEGHSRRVTEMTLRLARVLGMSEAELVHVRRGALLHDMGKLGVPDSILLKPAKPTDTEWDVMRQQARYASEILSPISYLCPALEMPYCHHEKWEGTGYPRGVKGEQIPLAARISVVVDVWDALRSDRPYLPGLID
jgi:PAS domain S-box-containing protein